MIKIDFLNKIQKFFLSKNDFDNFERLEEILLEADISIGLTKKILDKIKKKNIKKYEDFLDELKNIINEILSEKKTNIIFNENELNVILMLGVNGAGKTTTCAKIAKRFSDRNKKVLLVAADTFRAAATEQLEKLARTINVEMIKGKDGADPASVVFDSIIKAKKIGMDFLIIDTAGRLHTKFNLMQELIKIHKVILKEIDKKKLFVLLVLDANTGKNNIYQAKEFNDKIGLSGIILTKFDSTSKAGSILSVVDELKIPIEYITYGEKITDISEFTPKIFIDKFFIN